MINTQTNIIQINGSDIHLQALMLAVLIFVMAIIIVITNIVIIATYINYQGPMEVINYYYLSLSGADLLNGMLIVPLSVYPTLTGHWIYGDIVCRITGYLVITLWSITVYSFMWISVDRYLAVRKPGRYETVQTKTRCQCWVAFSWISSFMVMVPPILGVNRPVYEKDAAMCMLDWGDMKAYTTTLILLILGPTLISILYNYSYIISMFRKVRAGETFNDKEYATALAESFSNANHLVSFILVFTFWVFWIPCIFVRTYEVFTGEIISTPTSTFVLFWLGMSHSGIKFFIMLMFSPNFRLALKIFCLTICCQTRGRLQAELIGLDPDD